MPSRINKIFQKSDGFVHDDSQDGLYFDGHQAVVDVEGRATDSDDLLTVRRVLPGSAPVNAFQVLKNGTAKLYGALITTFGGAHSDLSGVTANQHHNQSHGHTGADGSGTVAHSDTTGKTANDHHNEVHVLADASALGSAHTTSGLTAGFVLRATAAAAARFMQLLHSDLGSVGANDHHNQSHTQSDHSGTGSTSTQAFGDSASDGTGTKPANIDHKHGMPASPTAVVITAAEATAQFSTSSTSFVDITGLSISVTTASASNVVEFLMTGSAQHSAAGATTYAIVNTSDNLTIDQKAVTHVAGGGDVNCLMVYRKTTSPASAKTIKGQMKVSSGTGYIGTGSPDRMSLVAREYR